MWTFTSDGHPSWARQWSSFSQGLAQVGWHDQRGRNGGQNQVHARYDFRQQRQERLECGTKSQKINSNADGRIALDVVKRKEKSERGRAWFSKV